MKIFGHSGLGAVSIAALVANIAPVVAQDVSGPATSASGHEPQGIADIVVTARKRSESLKDVPASILAVSQQQIANLNAKSLSDLNGVIPNASIDSSGQITIRGISSNTRNTGFEAGAAVYIDGVYQGRPIGNNQDLVDTAQVEILRGPQGTLYGKNTTAGAISLTTVRPGDHWSGRAELQYGRFNDLRVAGYVAGPLVDDLVGLKVSGYRRRSDGYEQDVALDRKYGEYDEAGGRTELRLTPGVFDIALRGDIALDDGQAAGGGEAVAGFAVVPGIDTVAGNYPFRSHRIGGGLSLTVNADLGGGYTFTSISAWRKLKYRIQGDDDYSTLDVAYHDWTDRYNQYSQEVRLASPSTSRLNWLVGAYYFMQDLKSARPVYLGSMFPIPNVVLNDDATIKTYSFAAFANADYHITDKLTLNAGLRYTHERKTLDFVQDGVLLAGYPNLDIQDRFSKGDLSPTAALSYKFSPAVTAYVKYSKGFKSGGWNPDITTTDHIGFGPEKVDNYEAGIRTVLLDDKLRINLTGYYMDYDNLQVSQYLGTFAGQVITNAGKARIKGVEAEVQAQPARWLTLGLGGAYNAAKYVDFESGFGVNYAGQQFANVPKFTGYATVDAKVPLSDRMDLVAHGDVRYQSKVYFDDQRTVSPVVGAYAQSGYALVNGRIGVALSNGLEVAAFVQNLTDKRAKILRISDALGLGLVLDSYQPPRGFGGRVSFHF